MNIYCANTADGILVSRDKLKSLQLLSKHKIGIPKTAFVRDKKDVLPAIERVGGAPVIIKLIEGTQGIGVLLAETQETAISIIELLQSQKQNVLIQKFVAESKGKDIRAFVVGDQVVAAIRRVAQGAEFRSNIHRGGKAENIKLTDEYREAAIKATQIMGLRVAGVDILESKAGPQILEVNSSPGLEGIEKSTGLDIAGSIVDYIAAQVDFPEIDIRQRLTVSRGYGVTEIQIPSGSKFENIEIGKTDLKDKGINILTLYRAGKAYPNPSDKKVLNAEDRVLCFGKIDLMRDLIPEKTKKRRTPRAKKLVTKIVGHSD